LGRNHEAKRLTKWSDHQISTEPLKYLSFNALIDSLVRPLFSSKERNIQMTVITCIEDLKQIYKRRVPKMFYDYAETGSWTEQTFVENTADFQDLRFRQKIAVNMEGRSTETTMIGHNVSMPVALAPVGLTGYAMR